MLAKMLEESGTLKTLPLPEQAIYMKLANKFTESTEYLFLTPDELVQWTELGNKEQWTYILKLVETQNFIKGLMAFMAQIDQRKTFKSLVEQALGGNQQAAKQVMELSGILNQQDSNRVIVLHQIPRPAKLETTIIEETETDGVGYES